MASTPIPPQAMPVLDSTGAMSNPWYRFMLALYGAGGGPEFDLEDVFALATMEEASGDLPSQSEGQLSLFNFSDEGEISLSPYEQLSLFAFSEESGTPDQNVALEQALTSFLYDTPEQQAPNYSFRTQLTASRTYYVRTDGNDANTGLANTAAGAFLTIQKAIDTVASLDIGVYSVTVEVGDGTYTAAVLLKDPVSSGGTCQLSGNTGTPANCEIAVATGDIIGTTGSRLWSVRGFKLSPTSGQCVGARSGGAVIINGAMQYNTTTSYHIFCTNTSRINVTAGYEIIGGANRHISVENASNVFFSSGLTITLTGTPAFSGFYAYVQRISSLIIFGQTFSGAATGTRYNVITNSVLDTNGGGATYLPGSVAGTTATGGQYV